MSDQPEVHTLATQLIRNAIKEIDAEVACDHVVATLGEDVDVDALAFGSEAAVREAQIDVSWDGDAGTEASRVARLARRVATNQISARAKQMSREADQLATTARQYAEAVKAGQEITSGGAWRLAQDALAVAQLASRLDGMREIAPLIPDA